MRKYKAKKLGQVCCVTFPKLCAQKQLAKNKILFELLCWVETLTPSNVLFIAMHLGRLRVPILDHWQLSFPNLLLGSDYHHSKLLSLVVFFCPTITCTSSTAFMPLKSFSDAPSGVISLFVCWVGSRTHKRVLFCPTMTCTFSIVILWENSWGFPFIWLESFLDRGTLSLFVNWVSSRTCKRAPFYPTLACTSSTIVIWENSWGFPFTPLELFSEPLRGIVCLFVCLFG